MDELTLRLPADTKRSLRAEAADRGVTVGEHVRDIIDAYRREHHGRDRPHVELEYAHTIEEGGTTDRETDATSGRSEELGTFSYGSRSLRP